MKKIETLFKVLRRMDQMVDADNELMQVIHDSNRVFEDELSEDDLELVSAAGNHFIMRKEITEKDK